MRTIAWLAGLLTLSWTLPALATDQRPRVGGDGKSSAGSRHLVEVVDKADVRPVWVSVWGGANTLAQALWDIRHSRDAAALDACVGKRAR